MTQCLRHGISHHAKHILSVLKAQLHLGRMDIHIQKFRLNLKMQHGKGVFVLHHKGLIGFLDGLADNAALYISSVNIIIFKIPVAAGNDRFSDKALHPEDLPRNGNRDQIGCDLTTVDRIDDIL